ncbi:hypothetical protein DOTSEDRAFT_18970 [Dothistroma septosporum NZE10]|uniref:Uncharacterized protein n=1 Tax=Dothistroma septosporum (strain NZE10 / CBS 128990) TaxID=675120 RepID=N1PYC6_DOTSN|nr:hypothetical protein DOTSEDRAFT_18970 [Dothistroma septosporum NZE10]
MSAVKAVKHVAKHGLRTAQNAPKAVRAITNEARPSIRYTIDATSGAQSSQHAAIDRRSLSKNREVDQPTLTSTNTPTKPHNNAFLQRSNSPSTKPSRQSALLTFIHEPFPRPINCTTFQSTRLFATDPSHPLYIRTHRRLAAFDPERLTWRVQVPVAVSKKPAIRREAERRVKRAVGAELDGREDFNGALLLIMNKDPMRSLRFRQEEVQKEVRAWVRRTLRERERCNNVTRRERSDDFQRHARELNGGSLRGNIGRDGSEGDPSSWRRVSAQSRGNGRMSLKDGMFKDGENLDKG